MTIELTPIQEREDLFLTVTTALGSAVTTDQVTNVIIQAALPIFRATVGLVVLLSEDGRTLISKRIVGVPEEEADRWRCFPIDSHLPLADAVRERRIVIFTTEQDHNAAYPDSAEIRTRAGTGAGALIAVPLVIGERCIGGIGLICPPERCSDEDQQNFLWTLAGQCALALERARLYDVESMARLDALAEIEDRKAMESALRESETRFRALADNIAQLAWMADRTGWLFWYNQRWFDYTGTTLEDMLGWEWHKVHHPEHLVRVIEKFRKHLDSGLPWEDTFPLRGKDGIYRWFLSRANPIFDERGAVVLWCGTNTDITEQREALAKSAVASRREALLNQIGQAVLSSTDAEEIQKLAVNALGEALKVDRCYFNFFNTSQDVMWIETDWRRPDIPSVAGRYQLSRVQPAVLSDLFRKTASVRINDVKDSYLQPETVALLDNGKYRSILTTPFYTENELTAVLVLAMSDTARKWSEDEVSLVEAVAAQTRAAVEAAQIRRREHAIAEQLARALQPKTPGEAPGLLLAEYYRPAWDDQGVGGDFSSVFASDKGITFLVVGDLSGKGLAAASQVATVRHMLHFALLNGHTVAGPIGALNRTLTDHDLLTGFAALFVGRYDSQTRQLTYVNCGQDPGLVLRSSSQEILSLRPTGHLLGAVAEAVFAEETVRLEDGDIIAIYTDGLTEAGPSRKELLTEDGMTELLRGVGGYSDPQQIVHRLMAGVDAHAGGGVRDDQCLLVAVVEERP